MAPPSSAAAADTAEAAASEEPSPSPTLQAPQRFHGVGDKIVRIKHGDEIWLAAIAHTGNSNFIVHTLDSDGQQVDGLVNEIGHYKGTVLFGLEAITEGTEVRALKIEAGGAWTIRLSDPALARRWDSQKVNGRGDDVLLLTPDSSGLETMQAVHIGRSNFIVHALTPDGPEGLINEIGRYRGEVQLPDGTVLVLVNADGAWTFTRGQV